MRTPIQKRRSQSGFQSDRGSFQGTRNETSQDSDDEENDDFSADDGSSSNMQEELAQVRHRGRPPKIREDSRRVPQSPRKLRQSSISAAKRSPSAKRLKRDEMTVQQRIQAESFIMKLFDRSLDLSKYTECTELYPICRAWMANQPRNPNIHSSKRSPSPEERKSNGAELLAQLKRLEIQEITAMPAPKKATLPKIPPVEVDEKFKAAETTVNLENATREEMLAHHRNRWKGVKSNWLKHTRRYQQRYEINHAIIQQLYKP